MDSYSVGSGVLVRWSRYEEISRWKTLFLQAHFPLFGSYLSSTCSQSPGCAFCGTAAEWNYHQGACQCQSGWWGSLMAPVLCMQRHRGFAAAGGMSLSAPETKGLGVGGVSAPSALPGCYTHSRAVLISSNLGRNRFATETIPLEKNGTPSCRNKRGSHLWSHPQACPINRLSGCTVRHQVHLPTWGSCVSSPLQCAWTPTRAPEPVCAMVQCAVLLPKHKTSWFIHFTQCKNVIKLHHTDKY